MKCNKCGDRFYIGQPDVQNCVIRYCPFCGSNDVVFEGFNPQSSEESI